MEAFLVVGCSLFVIKEYHDDLALVLQIDEMMKEAIQRDCTQYAPGIEIIGVRVTKPTIPHSIARNYEIMEEERTKVTFCLILIFD